MKPVRVESRNPIRSQQVCSPRKFTATQRTAITHAEWKHPTSPLIHEPTRTMDISLTAQRILDVNPHQSFLAIKE